MTRKLCVGICVVLLAGACSGDSGKTVGTKDDSGANNGGADTGVTPDTGTSCQGAECEGLLIVEAAETATTEAGGQVTLEVRLDRAPTANVQLAVSVSDDSEGSVGTTEVVFTPDNWNGIQTITVTGMDDDLADGEQAYQVVFGALESEDATFHGFVPDPVDLTNTDNDSAGITVGAPAGNTGENGDQTSFTVVLNSEPAADVTITLASTNAEEGTAAPASLTFTGANWAAPQTVAVTGQNDDLIDGDQPYTIAFDPSQSDDANYAGLTLEPVELVNVDDDSAGITVGAVSGHTSEGGTQATFTVALNSQPSADVTLAFASSDLTEGIAEPASFVFTTQNWAAPQTVVVTGQSDDVADGNQAYTVMFEAMVSDDADYGGLVPPMVQLVNDDDDTAGISVTTVVGTSNEDGEEANVTVQLTSEPFADVVVSFASNDASEGVANITELTFTPANWAAPQAITVAGQDDDLADGDQPYALAFNATTSNDGAYAVITPPNVMLTNADNDTAAINVSPIFGDTTEAGGTATFGVLLGSEPYGDVILSFDTSDAGEAVPAVTSLTFTPTNWDVPQSVTLTGVNDDVDDGNQPFNIVFGPTTSTDPAYAAITPMNVGAFNIDDDTAGITVTPRTGTTSETGGTASFVVVLNSQPTADVSLGFSSSDLTEGSIPPGSLVWTPATWRTPHLLVVTGVNDGLPDGNQPYTLNFAPTISADPNYDGVIVQQRALVNIDDEIPAVGTTGTVGRIVGDAWYVCRADAATAWVAANTSGEYNAVQACQSLGYSSVDAWGGTCGDLCGYCGTSNEYYGGTGGTDPTYLRYTVHWRCVR